MSFNCSSSDWEKGSEKWCLKGWLTFSYILNYIFKLFAKKKKNSIQISHVVRKVKLWARGPLKMLLTFKDEAQLSFLFIYNLQYYIFH